MAFKFKNYATDKKKELEGTWVPDSTDQSVDWLVARMPNEKFSRLVQKLLRPYARAVRTNSVDPKVMEGAQMEAAAHTVLLGYRCRNEKGEVDPAIKITNDDGSEFEVTPDSVLNIFKSHKDFYTYICEQAQDVANFKEEAVEDTAGNSGTSSGGTSGAGARKSSSKT